MQNSSKPPNDNSIDNYLRVHRIEELMEAEGYKRGSKKKGCTNQEDFAYDIDMEPSNFSRIMRSGKVTEKTCNRIIEAFPKYNLQWLLGYSDTKYKSTFVREFSTDKAIRQNAVITVLDSALHEVCAKENREIPTLDDIGELLLLEAQLQDYATALMSGYLHRSESHVWNYLDNIEQIQKGNKQNGKHSGKKK